tara:strand:+ start:660 stop:1328 length:669 start_codon:yes stop_codon:yes gene_type:complete
LIKRLLIIPARGNSKRIKNKNIKKFFGKPIISYSIDLAYKSKLFTEVKVSTESKKIFELVNKIKKNIGFKRKKNLSKDMTPLIEVFRDVVNYQKKNNLFYDEIWYINPCSPLINKYDLFRAAKEIRKNGINSVLSLSEFSPPIQWAFKKKGYKYTPLNDFSQKKRSQDLSKTFYDSGNFGCFKSDIFYKNKKIIFGGVEIPKDRAVDIDTIQDWKLAEKLFS